MLNTFSRSRTLSFYVWHVCFCFLKEENLHEVPTNVRKMTLSNYNYFEAFKLLSTMFKKF